MNDRKKIALLIDYDNFNQEKYFPILFEELNQLGDIIIKYAFYSNLNDGTIKNKFIKFGIEPKAQLAYSSGKNAVDIRITIDAMELLNLDYVDCVCLATNDSDFTPLIKTLQKHGRYVVGAGDNKAADTFKDACNTFISVEKISESLTTAQKDSSLENLVEIVTNIIETQSEEDDYLDFASLIHFIRLRMKDFNPKNYGASYAKPIYFFQKELSTFFEFKKVGNLYKIKVKSPSKKKIIT
jgi:uncharacterized protein (TIGR00288 family)